MIKKDRIKFNKHVDAALCRKGELVEQRGRTFYRIKTETSTVMAILDEEFDQKNIRSVYFKFETKPDGWMGISLKKNFHSIWDVTDSCDMFDNHLEEVVGW